MIMLRLPATYSLTIYQEFHRLVRRDPDAGIEVSVFTGDREGSRQAALEGFQVLLVEILVLFRQLMEHGAVVCYFLVRA